MPDYSVHRARVWAERALSSASWVEREAAKALLDLLPEPTLDEIGWDWDTHHMAGATTRDGDEVVMLWQDVDETEQIICDDSAWAPDCLTPNGKRYELREVAVSSNENVRPNQPEHPRVLETQQDFEDAPEGTIVTKRGCGPGVLLENGMWVTTSAEYPSEGMTITAPYTVLRWGWDGK